MSYPTPISISLCGILILTSGCATIIRGTDQPLQIMSDPPGARAALGTGQSCLTPCSVEVSRSTSTVVTFERAGCEREMISVFPTIAAAGVVLGGVIDYGTGAVYSLQPNPVVANLKCPLDQAVIPAPAAVTPAVAVIPVAEPLPAPVSTPTPTEAVIYNDTSAADTQLRNAEREFRAGRMSLEEFRSIKKVLQGD